MKKILIVTGPLAGHGGEETVLKTVIESLSRDYQVSLFVTDVLSEMDWLDPIRSRLSSVDTITHGELSSIQKMRRIIWTIRQKNADIVLALTPRLVLLASIARIAKIRRFKLISWVQFSITAKFSPRTARLLRLADYHFALNHGIKTQLEELGIATDHIEIVLNPIRRTKLVIPASPIGQSVNVVYVGRIQFAGEKNLQELITACAHLTGKWELHVFGGDDSKEQVESQKCRELIRHLHIEDSIIWHGFETNVWQHISTADCLALCSTFEGFGMVLCEAVAHGIPVVSSNCPVGPAEIVTEDNGVLYPVGDVQALTTHLQKFVDRQTEFNRAALPDTLERFYEDNYFARMKSYLDNL